MWTHVFQEYLRENEKLGTSFACSYKAQVEFFEKKKFQKSRDIVPLI